ncbi:MAG TPA: hypothetical protein P5511_10200, partial [Candidatus Goldiibacteriota bacterium]|nr:hypothetical protein [Candidatus Goldiibacteriota bacterium]
MSYDFGFPESGNAAQDSVDIGGIRRIAAVEAAKAWKNPIAVWELPCEDIYGNLNAYMCVFILDKAAPRS